MAELPPIMTYRLSEHAKLEMARRIISEDVVRETLASPEQAERVRPGRAVYQSRFQLGDPRRTYLVRVIVDIDREPPDVVTLYRTSKVEKYWRGKL